MGLGDKIKQTLTGEHSPAAERGEVDSKTPGSFPSEDISSGNPHTRGTMDQPTSGDKPRTLATDFAGLTEDPQTTTGASGTNKLHKSDDPRGWSSGDYESAQGYTTSPSAQHKYTDSGVGLKDYSYNDQSTGAGSRGLTHKKDHENLSHGGPYKEGYQYSKTHPSAADYSAFGAGSGTGSGLAAGQLGQGETEQNTTRTEDTDARNRVNNGRGKSSYEREDPYWGSLPQGTGTYNTVIGRGSEEETSGVHRQTPQTGDTLHQDRGLSSGEGLTQGAGTYNTVRGHGSQADTGAPYHDQAEAAGQQRSFPLRSGQGTARQDDYYDNMQQQEGKSKSSHPGFEAAGAAGAGAAAYGLYRHEQDKDKADKYRDTDASKKGTDPFAAAPLKQEQYEPAKEKKHHERSTDKSPKDERKRSGGLFGIFGRDKEDKPQDGADSSQSPTNRKPVAAAAAATTGAAEEAKHHHSHRDQPATTSTSNQPTAGYTAQREEGISGFPDQKPGRPEQKSHGRDSEIAAGLAGVGAGAGAAYGASKLHDRDSDTKQTGYGSSSSARNTVEPTKNTGFMAGPTGTSTSRDNDEYNRLGSGTSSGVRPNESNMVNPTTEGQQGTYAGTGRDTSKASNGKQMISDNDPTTAGSGSGTYNVLSSGTPSGVQIGDDTKTQGAKSSHTPAAVAGLAGAGLGAGTAAATHKHTTKSPYKEGYQYAKEQPLDEGESKTGATAGTADPYSQGYQYSQDQPLDQQKDRSAEYAGAGAVVGATGLGAAGLMGRHSKVTHKCENCGHDNDISHYFKDKKNTSSHY